MSTLWGWPLGQPLHADIGGFVISLGGDLFRTEFPWCFLQVKPALAGGKATNSVQHATPNKASTPAGRPGAAATSRSKANKLKPDAPAVALTPAKAGQKKAAPGKPGPVAATQARGAQSKAAATAKATESSETSDSSESEDEKPGAQLPAPKIGKERWGPRVGCIAAVTPSLRSVIATFLENYHKIAPCGG